MNEQKTKKGIGKVYPPRSMFFRIEAGEAKEDVTGVVYELSVHAGTNSPIIRNAKTGRWWAATWQDLILVAKSDGIDEP